MKRRIGYLPETPPLYPEMTVRGYLRFVARIKGVRRGQAGQRSWSGSPRPPASPR